MSYKFVIGNWKMYLKTAEAEQLATDLVKKLESIEAKDIAVVLCPSFTALTQVGEIIKSQLSIVSPPAGEAGRQLSLGAQNVSGYKPGAMTGEISADDLKELGCKYVIVGHSERRGFLAESNEMVNKKIKVVLSAGLIPIICVGETREERGSGQADHIIMTQVHKALANLKLADGQHIIIAYEPVWAIGTGDPVARGDALHAAQVVRQAVRDVFSETQDNQQISVIYGGSVNATSAAQYYQPGILEGVLVGGASVKVDSFTEIIKNFSIG
jgi:triosephosphate isomerase (TIM)